jgi:hypothetical protein
VQEQDPLGNFSAAFFLPRTLQNGTFIGLVIIAASVSTKYKIMRSLTPNLSAVRSPFDRVEQCAILSSADSLVLL